MVLKCQTSWRSLYCLLMYVGILLYILSYTSLWILEIQCGWHSSSGWYVCMHILLNYRGVLSIICTLIIQYCMSFKMICSLPCCPNYYVGRTVHHYLHSLFKISIDTDRSLVYVFKVVPPPIKGLTLSVCDIILVAP